MGGECVKVSLDSLLQRVELALRVNMVFPQQVELLHVAIYAINEVIAQGFEIVPLSWDQGVKGIDDLFLSFVLKKS